MGGGVAFRRLSGLARSQSAYERFSAATDLPLTLLAVLWVPVLVLPVVMHLPASVNRAFNLVDVGVWAVYAAEYLVRLYLVPARKRFVTHHLVDLAVVVLPLLRPLRALRLLRLFNLARAGVVLINALRRVRDILTHRGLHFVLLAAIGSWWSRRAWNWPSSSMRTAPISTTSANRCGGPSSP